MKKIADFLITFYILVYVFEPVFQYFVSFMGASSLFVIFKNIIPIIVFAICFLKMLKNKLIYTRFLLISGIIFFGVIIGILNNLSIIQVLFGIKVIIPFVALYLYIVCYKPNVNFVYWYRLLIPIIVLGLLLDKFIDMPWANLIVRVGSMEQEVSRQWSTWGVERLAGFQSASFDSGSILSLLILFRFISMYIGEKARFNYVDLVILFVGLYGVYLTTFKAAYIYTIILCGITIAFTFYTRNVLIRILTKMVTVLSLAYAIVPPIMSVWGGNLSLNFLNGGFYYKYFFSSYGTRMLITWPDSFRLLEGSILDGLFGRGLGGIGTAQKFAEPTLYSPADNFFVFLYVSFGIVSLLIIFWMLKVIIFNRENVSKTYVISSLILLMSIFGGTSIFVESIVLFLGAGIILGQYTNLMISNESRNDIEEKQLNLTRLSGETQLIDIKKIY